MTATSFGDLRDGILAEHVRDHMKLRERTSAQFNGNDGDKNICSLAWIGNGPSTCSHVGWYKIKM
jgi:hypothetical protein